MLLILALALPAAAATFYIAKNGNDTNACTGSYPCLTLKKGFSKAVRPGDTVIVKAGTYVVTPNQYSEGLSTTSSGTATSRIRYLAELKWSAKIVSSGAYAVWRNYGSYVDIQGFEIVGDSASNLGIDNRGSSVRVMDNITFQLPRDASTPMAEPALITATTRPATMIRCATSFMISGRFPSRMVYQPLPIARPSRGSIMPT